VAMNIEKNVYKKIKPIVRVSFVGKEKFFGKGIAELLQLVDKFGTIQKACKSMDMSYSKAWKIINRLEKELGFKVLETKAGGKKGGESVLTDDARDLLARYTKMNKDIEEYTIKEYKKYFCSKTT
jgi:molybdate transport repressor ModE-like protein